MYFYLKNNEIKMRSEQRIEAPLFEEIFLNITSDEKDKLERNWLGKIVNGKLELEMSHQELSEKQKIDREDLIIDMKNKLNKATKIDDIKLILNNILTDL